MFSASLAGSRMRLLLKLLKKSRFVMVTNEYAVEEAARNLNVKAPDRLAELTKLQKNLEIGRSIDIRSLAELKIAEKDTPIVGGAIASKCDYLLTGDVRDFGPYIGKDIGQVNVITPRKLADQLVREGLLRVKKAGKG